MDMVLDQIENAHSAMTYSTQFVEPMESPMPIYANSESVEESTLPTRVLVEFPTMSPIPLKLAIVLSISPLFVVKIMSPINLNVLWDVLEQDFKMKEVVLEIVDVQPLISLSAVWTERPSKMNAN